MKMQEVILMQANVLEWLEQTACNFPPKVALIDENKSLTYRKISRFGETHPI